MKLKGIDVSHHQGVIDWEKVKGQIDYAILSVGYGDDIKSQDDKQFHRNAKECTRLGIPFGVYIYSYATGVTQAMSEAYHVLRMVKDYKLDYPIYYDLEDANTTGKLFNKDILELAKAFCNIIESKGYWVGIYSYTHFFNSKLTDKTYDKWTKWVAQFNSSCDYKGTYDMWQYSSSGKVNGISGNVDMNISYKDFPSLINKKQVKPFKRFKIECTVPILNVRSGVGTNYAKRGILNLRERVEVLDRSGEWYKVRYYNAPKRIYDTGWVHSEYTKKI